MKLPYKSKTGTEKLYLLSEDMIKLKNFFRSDGGSDLRKNLSWLNICGSKKFAFININRICKKKSDRSINIFLF